MAAELFVPPSKALDANANPYAGAKWFFYESGTTTPQSVFTTAALSTPHANPVVADSSGKFPNIFFDPALLYRGILKNSTESVTLHDIDPVNSGIMSALAAPTGSALSGFQQDGAGAVAETTEIALRRIIFATQFGMSPAASAAVNLAGLKNAVAATPVGGTLIVPEGTYNIDVTGGLSNAVNVNKAMTLRINGTLICNGFAIQANPYYIFNITAADVHMVGTGTLQGNGTINDANSGDTTTHPGLVYVAADRFVFDLNVVNVPKVGIVLANCYDAKIAGRWKGGPTAYGSTGYFGIIATGGGRHIFDGARAERDALGGRFVNFIFTSNVAGNANDCTVRNCFADVWEKLAYCNGNGHYVHDNEGFGFQTDWIRFQGNNNRGYRNKATGSKGGISAYDGKNIEICDNTFIDCRQAGVFVGKLAVGYNAGFTGLKVTGNTLLGDSTSVILASGLHILTDGSDTSGVLVANNRVENFGQNAGDALVKVGAQSPYALSDVKIIGNKIGQTTKVGFALDQVLDSTIEGNTGASITQYFLVQSNSARLRWLNNSGSAITSNGVSGLDSTSQAIGNRFSNGAIEGTATLVAGTVTVNTAEILAGDRVSLTVQTPGGAQGHLSRGAIVAGTSFVINSSSATDTSTVYWRIEH